MLRIISIGTDRNIFNPESAASKRIAEYGSVFEELHLIVFSTEAHGLSPIQLANNVFAYPTNSKSKFGYISDAKKIGREIGSQIFFGQTVISVQDPFETSIVGVYLKKKLKVPLQIQIHTDFYSKGFYDGSLMNWCRFELARWVIPHGDSFRVVREKIANDLTRHFSIKENRIDILPILVDIERIESMPIVGHLKQEFPLFDRIFITASRLSKEKNVDMLIRAFDKVAKKFPQVGFVIVGDGSERKRLERLVSSLHLDERVVFLGWKQDVISCIKSADLFLHASQFEGYGMSIVEAASCGTPILTTDVGIVPDLFEDGKDAYVCKQGDEGCFKNYMISFLENTSFQSAVALGAKEKINTLRMTQEEYLNRYRDALLRAISHHEESRK